MLTAALVDLFMNIGREEREKNCLLPKQKKNAH